MTPFGTKRTLLRRRFESVVGGNAVILSELSKSPFMTRYGRSAHFKVEALFSGYIRMERLFSGLLGVQSDDAADGPGKLTAYSLLCLAHFSFTIEKRQAS